MMKKITILTMLVSLYSLPVSAEMTRCTLTYFLKGWSALYKEYDGSGVVSCANGQQANVSIQSRGGGFTFGKSEIDNGQGVFSELYDISEVYGDYIALDGHAGATKSVEGQIMTKGEVSLMLSGEGRGMDIGFALSVFTISPR